jgi:Chaperone of endosialidase
MIPLAFAWFIFLPTTRAVDPPPDGGYPVENTAEGEDALFSLTFGTENTALGYHALHECTLGFSNTAVGYDALTRNRTINNVSGAANTAVGSQALEVNSIGQDNTAIGSRALGLSTTGNGNTALGEEALYHDFTGSYNIAIGYLAALNCILSNNIIIGNLGTSRDSGTIRIGNPLVQTKTYVAGINGATLGNGIEVVINSDGQLGTITSSARYKEAIKPMKDASEAILSLHPVTFRYKKDLDPKGIPQFGLVAEDVEKINPDLVARDEQGKPYTVRYDAVNAMLLNEFLKEHQKVQRLEAVLAAVNERLKAQDAKIDKVNARVELTKPAPLTVLNN